MAGIKRETVQMKTKITAQEIGIKLREICAQLKAQVENIDHFNLARESGFNILASGRTKFWGVPWAVEVFVQDKGSERVIEFSALGNNFGAAYAELLMGAKNAPNSSIKNGTAYKMSSSIEKRDAMYEALSSYKL